MKIHGPYGTRDTKTGTFSEGFKGPKGKEMSHESDVETAGYRTLAQQINELIDAGERLRSQRKADYPYRSETPTQRVTRIDQERQNRSKNE